MRVGDVVVIDRVGLDQLVAALASRGMRTTGPVVRDGAICHGELSSSEAMPRGWRDEQGPGHYRIHHDEDDPRLFAWAVGPQSLKAGVFPADAILWRSPAGGTGTPDAPGPPDTGQVAVVGARPCELAALGVLDAVFGDAPIPDPAYRDRRAGTFTVVADCATPAATCFCSSMGTGPAAAGGYDLAFSELADARGHRFLVRVGSEHGGDVVDELAWQPATEEDLSAADAATAAAMAAMARAVDTEGLPAMLARTLEDPRWDDVAQRCLACGNCTLVCPTCFCSTIEDTSDLEGSLERRRRWSSCFEQRHSYMHGGAVRESTRARYRQWLTHKLGTWHDQFGMSGCVGCGRCIAWCPVGIDITEEVAALWAGDAAAHAAAAGAPGREGP